jgi:hypothetical protein
MIRAIRTQVYRSNSVDRIVETILTAGHDPPIRTG